MLILHKPEELQQLHCSCSCRVREIGWTAGEGAVFTELSAQQHFEVPAAATSIKLRGSQILAAFFGAFGLGDVFWMLFLDVLLSSFLLVGDHLSLNMTQMPFLSKWKNTQICLPSFQNSPGDRARLERRRVLRKSVGLWFAKNSWDLLPCALAHTAVLVQKQLMA